MWLFHKKVKEEIITDSKFKLDQFVNFHYKSDFRSGHIYKIYRNESGNIIYDIQVGGECPSIFYGINEESICSIERK